MNAEILIDAALRCGAAKANLISRDQVVLSAEFRDICKSNACGKYGLCWMCPPDIGAIDELIARVRAFPRGVIYQTIGRLEDSFDIEGMTAAALTHAQVSQQFEAEARAILNGLHLHLTCGGCHLCDVCAKAVGKPCRHPDKALMSLEGCGIDVYNTVRDTGLTYINGQNTVTYFGCLFFGED